MNYKLVEQKTIPGEKYDIVDKILINRGIAAGDVQHYLHTDRNDILPPQLLDNITKGAQMLIRHVAAEDDIFVQVDSDCDGITSAALLVNYLYTLFPTFTQTHVYYRLHTGKQHGLIPSTIGENIKLVIAPDSSSNDYAEHIELASRGIDILVLDHHEAEKISENACVINNQLCNYPTKSLSGVGIVYKFCCYLDELLDQHQADQFLDLVAVGLVGDMMDIRDFETKELIREGLKKVNNPLISEIKTLQNYSINKHGYFDPFAVAFYIVPLLNAIFRSGTAEERLLTFEAMLHYKAYEQIPSTKRGCAGQKETRAEQAARTCKNVKSRQDRTNDGILEIVQEKIKNKNLLDHKILIVQMDDEIDNKNLTGLLANQIANKYQKPTLILNPTVDIVSDVWHWDGSGRNFSNSPIYSLKDLIQESGLCDYAEGHGNAFGVGFTETQLEQFIEYTDNKLADIDFKPCYWVDEIYTANSFNPNDVLKIAELKSLWGQNLAEPMIAIENLAVHQGNVELRSPDKYPTLVIKLTNGVELIKFGIDPSEFEQFDKATGCIRINIVGKCDRNIWGNTITPQIKLENYEVIGSNEYYF